MCCRFTRKRSTYQFHSLQTGAWRTHSDLSDLCHVDRYSRRASASSLCTTSERFDQHVGRWRRQSQGRQYRKTYTFMSESTHAFRNFHVQEMGTCPSPAKIGGHTSLHVSSVSFSFTHFHLMHGPHLPVLYFHIYPRTTFLFTSIHSISAWYRNHSSRLLL
jgi:hypothetical protein